MKFLNTLMISLVLSLTFSQTSYGQSDFFAWCEALCKGQFYAMLGGGCNTVSGDSDYGDSGSIFGGALGFSAPIPLSERTKLEPGLLLNNKGGKSETDFSGDGIEGSYESKTTDTYLSLPLTARYSPIESVSGLSLIGGVQPSFLLASKTKASSTFGESETRRGTEGRNKLDAGLLVGAGYEFDFGLKVDAVYDHGLVNVSKNGGGFKNRSLRVVVGYRLPFNPYSKASYKKN
jgi:hypothetical protein